MYSTISKGFTGNKNADNSACIFVQIVRMGTCVSHNEIEPYLFFSYYIFTGDSGSRSKEQQLKSIERIRSLRKLSPECVTNKAKTVVTDDLLKQIEEDQLLKKQDLSSSFISVMKEKTAEYRRQLHEGACIATVTKDENDRFQEIFLGPLTGPKPTFFGNMDPKPSPKPKPCRII